jgi:SAM-dependent methyltransferase
VPGEWDEESSNWLAWARTPGFDAYWYYRDDFFDLVLPAGPAATLEIGCGEGRVARDLVARGHVVTGVDTAADLVRHAKDADRRSGYLVAEARRLPFHAERFDLVVAYNSLQVVPDMAVTVAECTRVLRRGGYLCFCVAHPVTDLGDWAGGDPGRLLIRQDYFDSIRVEATVERDGLRMTFRGWTHSLQAYATALHDAGLLIEIIREPQPRAPGRWDRWSAVPLFMNVRAVKP